MKTQRFSKLIVVCILVVLLALSLACGETTPTSEPKVSTATPATSDTQAPAATEASAPATDAPAPTNTPEPKPQYLGDVIEDYGVLLSAAAIEDPATPGMLYQAEAGKRLVAVEIIVGNVSGDSISVNPLNATLLDSEGFTYQPELAAYDGGQIATIGLSSAGEKVRGWIAFQVPENAELASIKYSVESFGNKFLQASLVQPPDDYSPDIQRLSITPTNALPKLGDLVEQFGYSLSAVTVEDPTKPGMLYKSKQGYKLVAVEIVLGNVSGDTLSVNPLNAVLVDTEGYVYTTELASRDGQIDTIDLSTGEKVKGWIAFEIPENAVPASIKYNTQVLSSNYIQTGLTN